MKRYIIPHVRGFVKFIFLSGRRIFRISWGGEGQALALQFARGSPSRGGLSPARLDGGEGQALALRLARGSPSRGGLSPQCLTAAMPLREPLFFFRSVRTYMSIETVWILFSRSARTLIKNRVAEWKRLRSFRTLAFLMSLLAIDMQVLWT